MAEEEEEEAAGGNEDGGLHFTLLLDKPLSGAVEVAAWNVDKDLLAMVTREHQLIVHRFNWQRLWAISPERRATAICWRPDGKALAVGHDSGAISLHDVENGELLRTVRVHQAAVECLQWTEEAAQSDAAPFPMLFQDRTPRFFPSAPRPPPMPGAAPSFDLAGALGDDASLSASRAGSRALHHRRLSVLVSGDEHGVICLSAFGVFPLARLDVRHLCPRIREPAALRVALSPDLRHLTVLCRGGRDGAMHAVAVDTALLGDRRRELRQVALQTSGVDELLEVLHASVAVMKKHWTDAVGGFGDRFQGLGAMLADHGSAASPQEELFSLLAGGAAGSGLHQFLASSVGEAGLKRLSKSFEAVGREMHVVVADHLQPAAEMIAFRLGELLALSRSGKGFLSVGLEEEVMERAVDAAGMVMVHIERVLLMVVDATAHFRVFLAWLSKALYQLNNEAVPQGDPPPPVEPAVVASFLRTHFLRDLVGPQLAAGGELQREEEEEKEEEEERMAELALVGGFQDKGFLRRTLFDQIKDLSERCLEAFSRPLKAMSPNFPARSSVLLCGLPGAGRDGRGLPLSHMYFEVKQEGGGRGQTKLQDYICFNMEVESGASSAVGILRGFGCKSQGADAYLDAVAVCLEGELCCVDLALYKNQQLILLVAERKAAGGEGARQAWLLLLNLDGLPFSRIAVPSGSPDLLHMCSSAGAFLSVGLKDGKARAVAQPEAVAPLAVSASRGLACVFAGQRRALLYDLEEDEQEKDEDMD